MGYEITVGEQTWKAEVEDRGQGRYVVVLDGVEHEVDATFPEKGVLHMIRDGVAWEMDVQRTERGQDVGMYGTRYEVGVLDERRKALAALGGGPGAGGGGETVSTSMPGRVVAVLVEVGDVVEPGQGVIVVEAMKMENELKAKAAGVVEKILATAGEPVEGGAPLVVLGPVEEA
jgi:biotin carboxyl carrier protein